MKLLTTTLLIVSSLFSSAQLFKFQCETVDQYPEFPGGDKALVYYLRDTLSNTLQRKGIPQSGELQVMANIMETGMVANVKVQKSPNGELSNEALALIQNMPRWAPAVNAGKPVACQIIFSIDASGNVNREERTVEGVSVVVAPENNNNASEQTLSRLAGVMQDYLLQKLPFVTTSNEFKGAVTVRFGMYPDGWVGRTKALKSDNKKLEEAVMNTINLFNAELAENRVNFKDELMRTFTATVSFKK